MPLADHLTEAPKLPGNKCFTCHWYAQISPEDKAFFDDWVANGYQNKQLHEACSREGLDVDPQSFSRHIREHHLKRAN